MFIAVKLKGPSAEHWAPRHLYSGIQKKSNSIMIGPVPPIEFNSNSAA